MRDVLGLLAALVIALSAIYYFLDILHGGTRPQRTSWAVWATVGLLGFGATREGGAGPGAWAAGVEALAGVAIFALSMHPRYGKAGGTRVDPLLCLLGLAGVALWRWGMLSMNLAALCAVSCEMVALWPTLREAWRQPYQESLLSWSADLVGHGLALSAVATVSLAALAYPIYSLAATVVVVTVLAMRRRAVPALVPSLSVFPALVIDEWPAPPPGIMRIESPLLPTERTPTRQASR